MSALIGHEALETALDWPDLIGQLRDWYRGKAVQAPDRQAAGRHRGIFADHAGLGSR